jgi:mannose-6-phosphate isomerase-like protein (cupin superfamily)
MSEALKLTPSESVTIVESTANKLVVEGTWGPGGKPPPRHRHPAQAERFDVLEGELRFRVGSEDRTVKAGEGIDVPVATPHQVWNPSGAQARATWVTKPPGRTEEWFRAVGAVNREARGAEPSVLAFAPLLTEYRDTFRLAVGPDFLIVPSIAVLGAVGRLFGHRAR